MSCDQFLGKGYNIASCAALMHMVAQQCDLEVGELVYVTGDTHIYSNHMDQVAEQLTRTPGHLPTLTLNKRDNINDYVFEDFDLGDTYVAQPTIRAKVAV